MEVFLLFLKVILDEEPSLVLPQFLNLEVWNVQWC